MVLRRHRGLIALLAAQLLLGLVASAVIMPWRGHEPDYYSVVRFLVDNGRLPTRDDYAGADRGADIAQATQGPLYFLVAAPVLTILDDDSPVPPASNPALVCDGNVQAVKYPYALTPAYDPPVSGAPAAGLALRFLSVLLALGTTTLTFATVRLILPSSPSTALVAAAFVAFVPPIWDLTVFISGESLLLLLSAANLYFAARLVTSLAVRFVDVTALIVTAVLGALTKSNGLVLIIVTPVVLLFVLWRQVRRNPRSRGTLVLLAGGALLLAGILALGAFNLHQYGSVIGRYQGLLEIALGRLQDLTVNNVVYSLKDTLLDYLGFFPVQRERLLVVYGFLGIAGILAFTGTVVMALAKRRWHVFRLYMLLSMYVLVALGLVILRGNLGDDYAPDKTHSPLRYYVSGIPALAMASAIGWAALSSLVFGDRVRKWVGDRSPKLMHLLGANVFGMACAVVWIAVDVWLIVSAAQYLPSTNVRTPSEFAALAEQQGLVAIDGGGGAAATPIIRAVDYATGADGFLTIKAFMQVEQTPSQNGAARITLSDSSGRSSVCELIPENGIYPVTRWSPGQVVEVVMDVPNCSVDGDGTLTGPIDVTLDWMPVDAQGTLTASGRIAAVRFVADVDLPRAESCLGNLGVVDDVFQVVQYNGPTTATPGERFVPSVNWFVRDAVPDGYTQRVYRLVHRESGEAFLCQGAPRLDDYGFYLWRRGEVVYFDQCAFDIPENVPEGEYTLSIGLIRSHPGEGSEQIQSQLVEVATITVGDEPQ